MQVPNGGNSLAARLPSAIVDALNLKERDEIEIHVADAREFEIALGRATAKAMERVRQLRRPVPAGFKFSRLESHER
jgi:antitoxin MazE